ncbi:hypothetical protein, partial [Aphanothece microscopica]|uniref:hypothetical protein n=1 Tax=Aphanothece microscopica TaxID=1049561 RepID=UPI0039850903
MCLTIGLAILAVGSASAEDGTEARLGRFAAQIMASFTPHGRFDPAGFVCAELIAGDPGLHECRDADSGLGFLYLPSETGDDLSVGVTRSAITARPTDLQVSDRAEAEALRTAFVALSDAPPFAGLPRCKTGGSEKQ